MRKTKQTLLSNEGCTAKAINLYTPHISDKAKEYMQRKPYSIRKQELKGV